MTFVDTNVLLDLVTDDATWASWSVAQLEAASLRGPLFINDVVYAELSVRYERIEALDAFIETAGLDMAAIPRAALYLAGKAYLSYRRARGARGGVLPDFFIGAQAAMERLPLLTCDANRYRTYFPTLSLIAPLRERRPATHSQTRVKSAGSSWRRAKAAATPAAECKRGSPVRLRSPFGAFRGAGSAGVSPASLRARQSVP